MFFLLFLKIVIFTGSLYEPYTMNTKMLEQV